MLVEVCCLLVLAVENKVSFCISGPWDLDLCCEGVVTAEILLLCVSGSCRRALSPAQPGLSDRLHRINNWLLGQGNIWWSNDTYKTPFCVQWWVEELVYCLEGNKLYGCNLKDLCLQMIRVKEMRRRCLKKMPVLCKFHYKQHPPVSFCYICASHLYLGFSFSPFRGSIEAEENSPSGSTPASPQTKTASEGELSTTAAELLQDYMTTVCSFCFLICSSGLLVWAL